MTITTDLEFDVRTLRMKAAFQKYEMHSDHAVLDDLGWFRNLALKNTEL